MADSGHESLDRSIVQGAVKPRYGEIKIRNHGRLPHWEKEQGLYFITFHLADSLPAEALRGITERQKILATAKLSGANLVPHQEMLVANFNAARIEEFFDRGLGRCPFKSPKIAEGMAIALRYWHGRKYRLVAWCIMPNHVHVICCLFPGIRLSEVVKSWKLYSARVANKILGRHGTFWQREYYDRLIRKEGELDRAIRYVLENPEKAGLRNWKWTWSEGQEALRTAGLETGAT